MLRKLFYHLFKRFALLHIAAIDASRDLYDEYLKSDATSTEPE